MAREIEKFAVLRNSETRVIPGVQRVLKLEKSSSAGDQKVQTYIYEMNKFWDIMYSMVTMVDNTVADIGKLLRGKILDVSSQEKMFVAK